MSVFFSKLGKYGRLGNQLFQIAVTEALAKENNVIAKFPKWEYSNYFKNQINQTLDLSEIKSSYSEPVFHYNEIKYSENMDLKGYFQSEKYFIKYKNHILNLFEFTDEIKQTDYQFADCSIHVRRTDYLNLQEYHPCCDLNYYQNAINIMKNNGCKTFLVFSDDIEWCKQNLSKEFIYVENQSNIKDLYLMSQCKNNIIANSSFSWWASWLNKTPNKNIIAPKKWFGPSNNVSTSDLYCKNWINL